MAAFEHLQRDINRLEGEEPKSPSFDRSFLDFKREIQEFRGYKDGLTPSQAAKLHRRLNELRGSIHDLFRMN